MSETLTEVLEELSFYVKQLEQGSMNERYKKIVERVKPVLDNPLTTLAEAMKTMGYFQESASTDMLIGLTARWIEYRASRTSCIDYVFIVEALVKAFHTKAYLSWEFFREQGLDGLEGIFLGKSINPSLGDHISIEQSEHVKSVSSSVLRPVAEIVGRLAKKKIPVAVKLLMVRDEG